MKKSTIVTIILIAAAVVLGVIFISWYLRKATPLYIQGTVECTTYKASSKVPGRIEEMKVEEGQHVTKGELLYTLSTPELNAKLQQAEAVKSAASAMDQKALTGARIQQKEAALNLWEKAQAGLLLAQKTFDRVNNLYEQGVVPAQKLDEARANLQAMQGDRACGQSAMRTGIRRSQQGGERGGGRPSTAGRRRRFGGGVLSFGCFGLLPCNGRGFDDHR